MPGGVRSRIHVPLGSCPSPRSSFAGTADAIISWSPGCRALPPLMVSLFSGPQSRIFLLVFRERGRRGERERERYRSAAPHAPWVGIEPRSWVCALVGNWTSNVLLHRTMLQLTEPPRQGLIISFDAQKFFILMKSNLFLLLLPIFGNKNSLLNPTS